MTSASAVPSRLPSPAVTHAAPFLVFMGFLGLKSFFKSPGESPPGTPWWMAHSEQWIYPIQTVTCLVLIALWWKAYPIHRISLKTTLLAVTVGAVGIALWILPSILRDVWNVPAWNQPEILGLKWNWEWLGLASRGGEGFNPTLWQDQPGVYWGTVIMRFVRMTIAVPILEELFWRSFLWRTIADPYRDFHLSPIGQWSGRALAATVPLFALAHQPADYLGAIIWALLISWVLVRTKSLTACIVVHATSNLLLGLYVMKTQQWGFW
ncbi:MAG: CAAX prenyl protease-related protein [Verrucomicrobiota bacterium]